jgi:hypothetical protein
MNNEIKTKEWYMMKYWEILGQLSSLVQTIKDGYPIKEDIYRAIERLYLDMKNERKNEIY